MYENYERNGKKAPEIENKGCQIIKNVFGIASDKNIILPIWECGEFDKK